MKIGEITNPTYELIATVTSMNTNRRDGWTIETWKEERFNM